MRSIFASVASEIITGFAVLGGLRLGRFYCAVHICQAAVVTYYTMINICMTMPISNCRSSTKKQQRRKVHEYICKEIHWKIASCRPEQAKITVNDWKARVAAIYRRKLLGGNATNKRRRNPCSNRSMAKSGSGGNLPFP